MSCYPLLSSSASCPPSGSATRSRPQDARANGPVAPFPSVTTPRTRSWSSTRPRPKPSDTSSKRYLDLQSFGKLVEDLDNKGIVTKRRNTKVRKYNGGIPFTYGPLAHFLKNRLYIGETGHKDKWFPGEHAAIVDRKTFDSVQQLLASKSADRKAHRTASEALLMGKLYDDRGNRMSPSFSTNKGVRYRFYVSSALLRGRKAEVGSIGRLAAQAIEEAVVKAVRNHLPADEPMNDTQFLDRHLSRVDLG